MNGLPTVLVLGVFLLSLGVCLGLTYLIIYLVNKHLARKQQGGTKND